MKFSIQSKLLLTHLNAVSKVISNKNAYAILDNFLFELEGERLVVTGSDMETRMTTTLDVPGAEGNGRFAIDVKRILSLLREMPDVGLTFEINEETLEVKITYLNGDYAATALNGDEYPLKAQGSGEVKELKLKESDVYRAIQNTVFAVGTDEMHPQFMGVYWDIQSDKVTFVASDSHKLVRYTKTDITPNMERSFILPSKPAAILCSVLDKNGKEDVHLSFDDTSATFETGKFTLSCRFVNGRYPKYNSVIPENNQYMLTVDRMTLLAALRRVSVFASVGGLLKLELSSDNVRLTTQDLDHSTSGEERIQCEYTGNDMVIGFKNTDIIEVVNNLESESVVIKLQAPDRPGIFLPSEQVAGEELLILQMPMVV